MRLVGHASLRNNALPKSEDSPWPAIVGNAVVRGSSFIADSGANCESEGMATSQWGNQWHGRAKYGSRRVPLSQRTPASASASDSAVWQRFQLSASGTLLWPGIQFWTAIAVPALVWVFKFPLSRPPICALQGRSRARRESMRKGPFVQASCAAACETVRRWRLRWDAR